MQSDLFNLSMSSSVERQAFQRSFFERKYTFRFDQLLGASLVFMVFFVLTFAWGVERGKAVSSRDFALTSKAPIAETRPVPEVVPVPAVQPPVAVPVLAQATTIEVSMDPIQSSTALPHEEVAAEVADVSASAKYTIAHMTYAKKEQAAKEIERIKSKGYESFVVASGRYYQLCVSGFASRQAANDAIKTLRTQGIVSSDAYIRNMPAL